MSYVRFGTMVATSTFIMFGLMYLNTYAFEHVMFSQTRMWMALLMGTTMAFIMLCPSSDHLAQFGSWISGVSASSLG